MELELAELHQVQPRRHRRSTAEVYPKVLRTWLTISKLMCLHELCIWIAAEFDWKPQDAKALEEVRDTRVDPHILGEFDIDITLTKRRIPRFSQTKVYQRTVNESLLTDEAFLPKRYTIRLEKGNFLWPYDAMKPESENKATPRFALRLTFDKSPYPPRNEWKEPGGAPDATRMWEWKEFCGRQSPELKNHWQQRSPSTGCLIC